VQRLIVSEKDEYLCLEDALNKAEPLCLCLEPFVGDHKLSLGFSPGNNFKVLAAHLSTSQDGFTSPRYATSLEGIPDSYFVLTHDDRGYTVFFCLSHEDQVVSLHGGKTLTLQAKSGDSRLANKTRNSLLCLRGNNLYKVVQQTMQLALELTGGLGKLSHQKIASVPWLNTLGWESGACFGLDVTHDKIMDAVSSLHNEGYPPGFVLIDEGWQQVEGSSMLSFEADPFRFPAKLKGLVNDLNQLGVKHVGVWHGMMGYRGGIHSQLAKKYDLPPDSQGRYFLGYNLGNTFQFFYDYYQYLRQQGVSFIKVGDQSSTGLYCRSGMDITLLYKNLQSAMQAAASIQFNSAHFNTDCLRNENLFYWTTSSLARAAEDIDLKNPLGISKAIRNNLTNALWLQHLMLPDFDAWTTTDEQNEALSIFHALSGSINVVSDPPGGHNKQFIKKMVLPGGALLKADKPLTLCQDSIFVNPIEEKHIYKAFTFKGNHGILALFNLYPGKPTLHGKASSRDIEGLQGNTFAVLSHHNGFVGIVKADEAISITLKPKQSDVLTFTPVKNGIAVLGCYSFFLTPGPITEVNIEEDSMHISSLVAAPMIIYCERQILEVRRNGTAIPWSYDFKRQTLSIDSRSHISPGHAVYSIAFES